MSSSLNKVALFGTSADPPTVAHQNILRWLSDNYDWVAVWASDNPFKNHQTSLKHRTEMLRLLIEEIDSPKNNISLYKELSHLRSLITVKKAKEIWGEDTKFTLVIGSDLLQQMPRWYKIEELLQQVQLLIVPRLGYPIQRHDLKTLRLLGGKYLIAEVTIPGFSSTIYREQGAEQTLTPKVKEYIKQKQLYQWFILKT
jgi:nicotinate-nucleotide adenylyltransferase